MYNNTNERGVRHTNQPAMHNQGLSYGQSGASGPAPTTAGHHKHDILNKLDPRVDSTHDRQPMSQTASSVPEGTYGPHSSRLANALDPRVDSDLDRTRAAGGPAAMGAGGGMMGSGGHVGRGVGAGGVGAAGMHRGAAAEGTYGPHTSRIANTLDPRVDSDRDGRAQVGAGHAGVGHAGVGTHVPVTGAGGGMVGGARHHAGAPAMGTTAGMGAGGMAAPHHTNAGPHKSGLMNKLDPRVDSKTGTWKPESRPGGAY